ncbi:MAG: hypothetical protein Q7S48_05200 [bacterium]|nr:hypothetical protein [bacterium]
MMLLYWILGIVLIVWIVRELTNKKVLTETKPTLHEDGKDKKDSSCCH